MSPHDIYLCKNGGTCEPDEKYSNATCSCPDRYEGKYCETGIIEFWPLPTFRHDHVQTLIFVSLPSLDKCSPDGNYICENGGTCNITAGGNVVCICKKEYVGAHCEEGKK